MTETEQLTEPLVLGAERGEKLGQIGSGVALRRDCPKANPAGPTLFSAGLEPNEGN
jgi:hypothetical protein